MEKGGGGRRSPTAAGAPRNEPALITDSRLRGPGQTGGIDILGSSAVLTLFAELGAGIAGFSGVIVALDGRPVPAWSQRRRDGLRSLLQVSAVLVLFSLLPMILGRRLAEPALWSWALKAYGVAHVADVLSFLLRYGPDTPRSVKVGAWIGLVVAVTQLTLAFVVSPGTAEMVYLAVLTWHLVIAAGSFAFMLYSRDVETEEL